MTALWQDIKYGFRMLARSPGFTVVVILVLAIGIGTTTAMLSIIDAVMLRPAPYRDPDRLVHLYQNRIGDKAGRGSSSYPNYADWRDQSTVFDHVAGYTGSRFTAMKDSKREWVFGMAVTPEYFSVLGVKPEQGRCFSPEEGRSGGEPVVVISHSFWQSWFGGDPEILGKSVVLDEKVYTVIGVLPAHFRYVNRRELHLYVALAPFFGITGDAEERGQSCMLAIARLKPGMTMTQAGAEMDHIGRRLAQAYPQANAGTTVSIVPITQEYREMVGQSRRVLFVAQGIVAFLLLITCLHVASLLLIRSATREKEMAVRATLGAGRLRLIRQLLTEGVLLAFLGGMFGLLLAHWSLGFVSALKSGPDSWYVARQLQKLIPWFVDLRLDARTFLYGVGVSLLTCGLFGALPAIWGSAFDLNRSLSPGRSGGQGIRCHGMRSVLVAIDVALAFVLLIGAGLLVNSYTRLNTGIGYNPDGVLSVTMGPDESRPSYSQFERRLAFFEQVLERVTSIPGVQSAAVADQTPASGGGNFPRFQIEGISPAEYNPEDKEGFPGIHLRQVSPDYFRVLQTPLLKGRYFSRLDTASTSAVAIISESMARRFWPAGNPIDKYLTQIRERRTDEGRTEIERRAYRIVGVVGNIRQFTDPKAGPPEPVVYVSHAQTEWSGYMSLLLCTNTDPRGLVKTLRSKVLAVDENTQIRSIALLEDVIADYILPQRFNMASLCAFAGVALVLASIGVYGTTAYAVSRRTREIGIRMALGARSVEVLTTVLHLGIRITGIGLAIGLVGALAAMRVIRSLLYDVSPTDPATFVCVALLLTSVTLLASYLPARRAARIDPMEALRHE